MINHEPNPACIGLDEVFDPDAFRNLVLEGFMPPSEVPSANGADDPDRPGEG